MVNKITSRDNKLLKTVRSLHKKKGREQTGLYFAEGVRLVDEALLHIRGAVKYLLVSDSFAYKNENKIHDTEQTGIDIYILPDKLFDEICDTQTPQGIAAVIEMQKIYTDNFSGVEYALILDGIAEPGNMGTIIRTAEAAGIELILLMEGCTDIYSPKVVRSAMGSLFRMKFLHTDYTAVEQLKENGFFIAATALENSQPIENVKISGCRAVVIGNEAHGVSQRITELCDMAVRIDMKGKVESLNAAVAAGISMYMLRP